MAQSTPPSTTETLLLPLRVWPKGDPNKKSLPSLIQRINEQRGPFRGVTEASLEEEIRAQEARAAQPDEDIEDETGDDQANKPENEVGRREVLLKAKEDILKQVGQAYMEAYYALDFVSLLLSKDSPRQAELSMSQHLKQHVPMGSLGMEKVQPQPERLQDIKDREMVQLGWKMQSLQSTADSLLAAATRLETEVQHETQYWEQVLAIDNERWSLCRMPRERHTLGVRFGFLEAAAEFRDRGLGALRRGEGGKIILDQGLATSIPRVVRVRIETRAGGITSSSTVPTLANPDTSPIEELILQARNAIYEEELFHEITRETRLLMNQGVRNTDSVIILTLPDRRRVLIDLVPLEDYHHLPQQPPEQSQSQGGENGRKKEHVENNPKSYLAEGIALSLRLLLSHTHRQHFLQRSQIPPPLTDRKRTQPPPAIIRPVLSHLMHRSVITFLDEFLKGVEEALDSAGLNASHTVIMGSNCSITSSRSSTDTTISTEGRRKMNKRKMTEKIIETFANGIESIISIILPGGYSMEIHPRTQLYPPISGTEYLVNLRYQPHQPHQPQPQRQRPRDSSASFGTTTTTKKKDSKQRDNHRDIISRLKFFTETETRRYISHIITLGIIEEIKNWPSPFTSSSSFSSSSSTRTSPRKGNINTDNNDTRSGPRSGSGLRGELRREGGLRNGNPNRTLEISPWVSTSFFNELVLTAHKIGQSKRLQILVFDGEDDDEYGGGGTMGITDDDDDDDERGGKTGVVTVLVKWGYVSGSEMVGTGSYRWLGTKNKKNLGGEMGGDVEDVGEEHEDDDEGPKRSLRAVVAEAAQFPFL